MATPLDEPDILYHYTDIGGLKGILQSRELRASHTGFMNDRSETQRGKELVQTAFNARNGRVPIQGSLGHWFRQDLMFVACFCAAEDALEMWRAYAPNHGVCIGLRRAALAAVDVAGKDVRISPVIYNEADFVATIEAALDEAEAGRRPAGCQRQLKTDQLSAIEN